MKDLPGHTPDGLAIVCTPERADPRDVLVGPGGATLAGLPAGTRVGTSSLRRAALAKRINPGIEIVSIRGNVPTRIKKIADGVCDVVLLAAAGLERLELSQHVAQYLDVDSFCPAACQGILAIEARSDDVGLHELLAPLEHTDTATRAAAERAFLARLEGGCQVPMACHAWLRRGTLNVRGLVVGVDGEPLFEARELGASSSAARLGHTVAERLLAMGADEILAQAHR
jgi:hydroxymethylbilane synthase